jgi:cytochrome c
MTPSLKRRTSRLAFYVSIAIVALLGAAGCQATHPASPAALPTGTLGMRSALERLAEPTLPANPAQADVGARAYWLNCMPCHGDKGQGLTVEFRQLYPEDHQDCWKSGCHGARPYTNGWTLPKQVPALIGESALDRFGTAAGLFAFAKAAMPFNAPGSLDDQTYWSIVSYLLVQNGVVRGDVQVGPVNAAGILVRNPGLQP